MTDKPSASPATSHAQHVGFTRSHVEGLRKVAQENYQAYAEGGSGCSTVTSSELWFLCDKALEAYAASEIAPKPLQEIMYEVFTYADLHHTFRGFDGEPDSEPRTFAREAMAEQDRKIRGMISALSATRRSILQEVAMNYVAADKPVFQAWLDREIRGE